MQLNKEEYLGWREHPGTKALMKLLAERRQEIMEDWSAGAFLSAENDVKVGQCQALEAMVNVTFEDLSGESNGE